MSPKRSWKPITPGIRDWTEQMDAEHVERFEAAAGDLLDELGYARAFPEPRADLVARARTIRDRFTKDPHFKERSLPAGWQND